MRRTVTAFAAGLAIGGLGLLAIGYGDAAGQPPEQEPRVVERTRVLSTPYDGPSLAAIRETVRAEVAAATAPGADPGVVREAAAPADPEREAEAAAAYADATETFDAALARGTWTDEDAQALRSRLGRMEAGQARETLDALMVAINTGQLVVEADGVPF